MTSLSGPNESRRLTLAPQAAPGGQAAKAPAVAPQKPPRQQSTLGPDGSAPAGAALVAAPGAMAGGLDTLLAEGSFDLPVEAPVGAGQTTLRPGDWGPEVLRLQEALQVVGMLEGPPNGQMDEATSRAVVAYQRRFGLEADGLVGPATWAKVDEHLGMQGEGARLMRNGEASVPVGPSVLAQAVAPPEAAWVPTPVAAQHEVSVADLPSAPATTEEAQAYAALEAFDAAPNPLGLEATLALAQEASEHQASLLTVRVRIPVDGGARTLEVLMEAGIDQDEALAAVAEVYEGSHPEHRQAVERVVLHAGPSALDEYFEVRNAHPEDFVSAMNAGQGTIRFFNVGHPDHPLRQDLWDHEVGHVVMENHPLTSEEAMVPEGWAEAMAQDLASGHDQLPTPYAATNHKEDFAEAYRFYVDALRDGDGDRYRRDYPHRSIILDRLFR